MEQRPELLALSQYGRYLTCGLARGLAAAAGAQGVWNDGLAAAEWTDDYTRHNTQQNYWPAEVCTIGVQTPLLD